MNIFFMWYWIFASLFSNLISMFLHSFRAHSVSNTMTHKHIFGINLFHKKISFIYNVNFTYTYTHTYTDTNQIILQKNSTTENLLFQFHLYLSKLWLISRTIRAAIIYKKMTTNPTWIYYNTFIWIIASYIKKNIYTSIIYSRKFIRNTTIIL